MQPAGSPVAHDILSSHGVPSGSVLASQVPSLRQTPSRAQASVLAHGVPAGSVFSTQAPLASSHTEKTHGPLGGQGFGLPTQVPPEQATFCRHLPGKLQGVPFGALAAAQAPVAESHAAA